MRFARPEDSPAEHERLTGHAETVLQRLEIPVPRARARRRRHRVRQRADLRSRGLGGGRRAPGSKRRARARSPTFRRAAPTSATGRSPRPSPSSCTRSTPRASRSPARSSPSWRTTKRPTGRCGCRRHWFRISASIAWSRVRRERLQRLAPTVVVVLVALLAGLSFGSGLLVLRHFKADATATSRLYSGVFGGLNDPRPGARSRGAAPARRAGAGARPAARGDRPGRARDRGGEPARSRRRSTTRG